MIVRTMDEPPLTSFSVTHVTYVSPLLTIGAQTRFDPPLTYLRSLGCLRSNRISLRLAGPGSSNTLCRLCNPDMVIARDRDLPHVRRTNGL